MEPLQLILIPLLPFLGFLLLGLGGKSLKNYSGLIGSGIMFCSTALAAIVAWNYFHLAPDSNGAYQTMIPVNYSWLRFNEFLSIQMGIMIDPLSVMMLLVVTFVSLMVNIYSIGYMHDEERKGTFFAFLGLFTFSMLGLVMASNLFQIYIFWELVGVSSFLLIGFYYDKPSAVAASKKAFIVTRFADLGFLAGILILSFEGESLDFQTLISNLSTPGNAILESSAAASFMGLSALTWGLMLVFMGGAGKSAMFPLHIWLPDAMEGPTPVSALIHAATMVVAGVFLVARLFPVFSIACPGALDVVAVTGIFSALFAAIIACTQTDIKRILAYSTMSQIGFMMFSLGVSGYGGENGLGYAASLFHLFTHAMFKALLFLGAGSVIHFVHSNEMKDMGGLRKLMPVTHLVFLVACLAIAGVPPFAGFFSKEQILLAAFNDSPLIYGLALLTSGLTAFYMFRLYYSVFWNKDFTGQTHSHEAPLSMLLPISILGLLTVVAGFIPFSRFVGSDKIPFETHFHFSFAVAPILVAIAGILLATKYFKIHSSKPEAIAGSLGGLFMIVKQKFMIDEVYLFITKRGIFKFMGAPAAWFDRNIVDGLVNTAALLTANISESVKGVQSGKIQPYGLYFMAGILGLVLWVIYYMN